MRHRRSITARLNHQARKMGIHAFFVAAPGVLARLLH